MGWTQRLFGRRKPDQTPTELVRESVEVIQSYRQPLTFGVLSPDEVGQFRPKQLTIKDIQSMTASKLLGTLMDMSPDMNGAVNMWVKHVATKATLDSSDTSAQNIIEDFIAQTERGNITFQGKYEIAAYNRYVEGGLFAELFFDETGEMPLDIALPSPFSLRYYEEEDVNYGKYYVVGQGLTRRDFKVLQDLANPNPLVEWQPTGKVNGKPYGRSSIGSNIFGTVAIGELVQMIMEYVRGQAMPKGVVSIPRTPLAQSGYTPSQISEIVNKAERKIEKALSEADLTQALTVAMEVSYVVMGAMGRSNLDASEMIVRMLEKSQRRGYRLPRPLYGSDDRGNTLNSSGERVEWEAFGRLIQPEREIIEEVFGNLFRVILRHYGNTGECRPKFSDEDTELSRIIAEARQIQIDGYATLMQNGVVAASEVRGVIRNTFDEFAELPDEIPEDVEPEPEPEPVGAE